MNKDTYIIGAGLNYETKVNLNYKKWYMLNFVCAEHIMQLLDDSRSSNLSYEQIERLRMHIKKLIRYGYRRTLPVS